MSATLPLGVLVLGLAGAAPLALHAAGLVLVHRTHRFLNLAQLQLGAVAATLFVLLVNAQPLLRGVRATCPPCLEQVTSGVRAANYVVSLVVSLAVATGLGWLMHALVVRRLQTASRLVLTVASLFVVSLLTGVQRGLVHALSTERQRVFGGLTDAVPPPLTASVRVEPVVLTLPDLVLTAAALLAVLALGAWLARSATGRHVRAVSDNPARAETLGISVTRVGGRVWLLVGALSGLAAVLGAMTTGAGDGTSAATGSTLVRALAIATIARFVSLRLVVAGAVGVGVAAAATEFWLGSTAVLDAGLVVVVGVVLLLRRPERARAGSTTSSLTGPPVLPVPAVLAALPGVRTARRALVITMALTLVALPLLLSPSQVSNLSTVFALAVVGLSLLVLTGWAGRVSLAQLAFAAVGAWVAAVSGLPFLIAVLAGGTAAALVALAVGLPALRLGGLELAVSTLAFAVAVPAVLLDREQLGRFLPEELPAPSLLGSSLDNAPTRYATTLGLLVVASVAVNGLRRSRTGRVLIAGRDNEAAAQAYGVNLLRVRRQAFALSGFLAGVAGGLLAFLQAGVAPDTFGVEAGLSVFTYAVLGGLGSVSGPLLGFAVLGVASLGAVPPGLLLLVSGLGGLLLLQLAPGGLAQLVLALRDATLRRAARRAGLDVPALGVAAEDVVPLAPTSSPVPVRYRLPGQWATTEKARQAALSGRGPT